MNTIQKCECASCGRYFVRDSAFFMHRTGVYADEMRQVRIAFKVARKRAVLVTGPPDDGEASDDHAGSR